MPNEECDLDLLIVVDTLVNDRHRALVRGHSALIGLMLSKDLLLITREFEKNSEDVPPSNIIKRQGKQMYAKALWISLNP